RSGCGHDIHDHPGHGGDADLGDLTDSSPHRLEDGYTTSRDLTHARSSHLILVAVHARLLIENRTTEQMRR
ncbi:hypothetical protein, partial [Micrococcus sp. KRD077]|uniref:hypothetical protein n=1 Tax=Micrococcus sp. KRD077 TaxID=2729720 RepID=UPI0019D11BEF